MKQKTKHLEAEVIVSAKTPQCLSCFILLLKLLGVMSKRSLCFRLRKCDCDEEFMPSDVQLLSDEESFSWDVEEVPPSMEGDVRRSAHPTQLLRISGMKEMLDELVEQGVLGEGYQLKSQSWTEKSVIVAFLSGKLRKKCMWSAFAELWACDKNALQSAYSKHCDTTAARRYYQKLSSILG